MAYVCEVLQTIDNVQTCVEWAIYTEPDLFKSIAITGSQAKLLYVEFTKICVLFIAFVAAGKAAKLL